MEDYRSVDRQLIDACREYPPDFVKINRLLDQGANVNAVSATGGDECLLFEIILGYPEVLELRAAYCERCPDQSCDGCGLNVPDADGRYLPLIIQFFLEHGFVASGRMGAACLQALTWSSYDRYILDSCKLLMAAGADPSMVPLPDDSGESVISWVAAKVSAAWCCDDDPVRANLFETMYRMMKAKAQGRDYTLIDLFDVCVGRTVCGVRLCSDDRLLRDVFRVNRPATSPSNCFHNTIVLDCQGKMLCVDRFGYLCVDPHVPQYAGAAVDLAPQFQSCIGHRIKGIDFSCRSIAKNGSSLTQPIALIQLGNGTELRFFSFSGQAAPGEAAVRLEVEEPSLQP